MAHIIEDRVMETSTTTGTGNLSLAGAVTGFRAFDDVMANGDTCYYLIEAVDGDGVPTGDWETGFGTFNDTDTLVRTTVLESSNAGAAVNFAAGTKRAALTRPGATLNKRLIATIDYTSTPSASNDIAITGYDEVWLEFDGLTIVAAGEYGWRLSSDNGSTFFDGASDYTITAYNQTVADNNVNRSIARISSGATTGLSGFVHIRGLNRTGVKPHFTVGSSMIVGAAGMGFGHVNQTGGPFTHVRVVKLSGNNSTAGIIYVYGI